MVLIPFIIISHSNTTILYLNNPPLFLLQNLQIPASHFSLLPHCAHPILTHLLMNYSFSSYMFQNCNCIVNYYSRIPLFCHQKLTFHYYIEHMYDCEVFQENFLNNSLFPRCKFHSMGINQLNKSLLVL